MRARIASRTKRKHATASHSDRHLFVVALTRARLHVHMLPSYWHFWASKHLLRNLSGDGSTRAQAIGRGSACLQRRCILSLLKLESRQTATFRIVKKKLDASIRFIRNTCLNPAEHPPTTGILFVAALNTPVQYAVRSLYRSIQSSHYRI